MDHSFQVHYWLCVNFVPYTMILKKHILRSLLTEFVSGLRVSSKYFFGVASKVDGRVLSIVRVWAGSLGECVSSPVVWWFWRHSFALSLGTCGTVQQPHFKDQDIGAWKGFKGLLKPMPFVCKPAENIWVPQQLFPVWSSFLFFFFLVEEPRN